MAVALQKGVFIVAGKRTPFGKIGRSFKDVHPSDLLACAVKQALATGALEPSLVDTTNVGQVFTISGSSDGFLTPRHAALKAGVPQEKPALGVNCLCGSGFQALVYSALDILTASAHISIAGGVENMSAVPHLARNIRFGVRLGDIKLEDFILAGALDSYCGFTMAQTAENLAELYNLQREQLDEFALGSQRKWKAAYDSGAFKAEIAPVTVTEKDQTRVVDTDEHPQQENTLEALGKLPALFRKGGVGTAGNSTGINDGAGAVILASEEAVKQHNLTPLVRLLGWSHAGVEPSLMGLGPVPAIRKLLTATGYTLGDMDMVEINEPFAGQTLASVIELGLDQSKLNVNGGAIAIRHPSAASGVRIMAHLAHELGRRGWKRGIGSTCFGGGQGIALLVEAI